MTVTFSEHQTQFRVFIEGNYPKQPPTVACTTYTLGEVTDGRDLLVAVLGHSWTDKNCIADILSSLPEFTVPPTQKSLQAHFDSSQSLTHFGEFHLSYPMHLDLWTQHPSTQVFPCTEIDHRGFRSPKERLLVLTPTVVLVLEPSQRFKGIGHLLLFAPYSALASVRWLNFNKEILSFYWKQGEESFGHQLHFTEPASVLDCLFAKTRACGIEGVKATAPEVLSEEEVKSTPKIDIDRMVMEIDATESEVVRTPTLDAVNGLLATFQRVIEYYSAVGDGKYDVYLKRMHEMLHNEGIQKLLGYTEGRVVDTVRSDSMEDAPLLASPVVTGSDPTSFPAAPSEDTEDQPLFAVDPTAMASPPTL